MNNTNLTNNNNLGLTLSVWLANDGYDYSSNETADDGVPIISATKLMRPIKSLILSHRMPKSDSEVDITDLVKARLGQSIHTEIEASFNSDKLSLLLHNLGYPENIINNIIINPDVPPKDNKAIPIYLEKRAYRKIISSSGTEVWISGKFDQVIAGKPEDNKTTSVYKYLNADQSEEGEYALQMSIYKWLNPEIITSDVGQINFIFTDWRIADKNKMPNYPDKSVIEMPVNLMSLEDTENYIRKRIDLIEKNSKFADQSDMIRCTDKELWRSKDTFKFYKNPETAKKGGRSTKNFDNYSKAMLHKSTVGAGVVVTVPGRVRRCDYCDAAVACTQRLEYQSE